MSLVGGAMANEVDLAHPFDVSVPMIDAWKAKHLDFLGSSDLQALWAMDNVRKNSRYAST